MDCSLNVPGRMAIIAGIVKNTARTQLRELSVVIPALNAASRLAATLKALTGDAELGEIIVIDGGSTDRTRTEAANGGARVFTVGRGRGIQLAAGAEQASGAWLLLLHADTVLTPGWAEATAAHMCCWPGHAAYFRFALDSADRRARTLERWVARRCSVLGLPYGDQGLLIHRDLLCAVGGVRPLPLMEDVDLVRRIGRRRLRALDIAAVTAANRWERAGWGRRSARNLFCLGLYFFRIPPSTIARLYE